MDGCAGAALMASRGMDPRIRTEAFRIGFATVLVAWLVKHLAGGVWWLIRQPVLWVLAVSAYVGWRLWDGSGPTALVLVAVALVVVLVAWRLVHAASFRSMVWWPVRAWWRRGFVYAPEWEPLMTALHLTTKKAGEDERLVPQLLRVRSTASVDKLRVRMQAGQVLADFAKNADRLAATFQASDCRVRSIPRRQPKKELVFRVKRAMGRTVEPPKPKPSRLLELWFLVDDPLHAPTPLLGVPDRPNLKALPLALREDGLTWTLRLLATHVLVIGVTGAGKGSVLWSIVRALGHGIRTRLVELWVIDPKGGMEFAAGQRLFARYCYGDDTPKAVDGQTDPKSKSGYEWGFVDFLEAAVTEMRSRQARLRGILRTHRPKPGDPLIVVMVDEFASLTAYLTDREAKKRIDNALSLLLSQGRAVGIVVIAAAQDPRKEVVDMRGLFPTRIALRLAEPDEVDLVLRKGARDRGARCDEIGEHQPGTAYAAVEGTAEPVRIRFAYIDDDQIRTMCSLFEPGGHATGLRLVHGDGPWASQEDEDRTRVEEVSA